VAEINMETFARKLAFKLAVFSQNLFRFDDAGEELLSSDLRVRF
jgi:hypothetical protein